MRTKKGESLKVCEHGYILLTCRACLTNLLNDERLSRNRKFYEERLE